jgi:hypothetical protein
MYRIGSKGFFMLRTLGLLLLLLPNSSRLLAATVVDFNELSLGANSYFDGYGSGAVNGSWSSQSVSFPTATFGPGWSYSNVNNTTTPGFGNQWAVITGTGLGGSGNYALTAGGPQVDATFESQAAIINLPIGMKADSFYVTNTTYAYLSMRDGDTFAKKLGGVSGNDPDYFKATFQGYSGSGLSGSVTGSIDFFLADFRFGNNALDYLVNQWTLVDLSPLGNAASIGVRFDGSDATTYTFGTYLNHPAYLAIDNFSISAVPEPTSISLVASVLLAGCLNRRRRRWAANR